MLGHRSSGNAFAACSPLARAPRLLLAGPRILLTWPDQSAAVVAAIHRFARSHYRRHWYDDTGRDDPGHAWSHRPAAGSRHGRLLAPFAGVQFMLVLSLAGFAWSAAFGLFALLYLRPLVQPRVPRGLDAQPI